MQMVPNILSHMMNLYEPINQIFFELKCYETATGAKVNVEKTDGLWLGSRKGRQYRLYNCKLTSDKVKVLGL